MQDCEQFIIQVTVNLSIKADEIIMAHKNIYWWELASTSRAASYFQQGLDGI